MSSETPDVGDKRLDPKSWAFALKAREEAGERLTFAQREMWRQALRPRVPESQDERA